MAKIDVIVPCYNYARFLPACVASILKQPIQDIRVLIIDDASSDDTLAVARALAASDPRISIISHSKNQGCNFTYNEGFAWASADYLMLLSADDLLAPGALARAVPILDAHPDIAFVYGHCIEFEDSLPVSDTGEQFGYSWNRYDGIDFIRSYCTSGINFVQTSAALVRTSVQKTVGGYRPYLPHTGDMEIWLRLAANGAVAGISAVQGLKRSHSSNMANGYYADIYPDFKQRQEAFSSFFAEYGDRLPEARTLQSQANRVLAEDAFWTAIGLMCRGQGSSGRQLLRFAVDLQPRLRYWPPLTRLKQIPHLPSKVAMALSIRFGALFGRPVKPWNE